MRIHNILTAFIDNTKSKSTFNILLLTAVALIIRLIYIWLHPITALQGDEITYVNFAKSIVSGNGFSLHGQPTSFYPPLYSFFIALFFYLFGGNIFFIKFFQAMLASLFCIPFYLYTKKLFSESVAIYATAFYAIYVSLIASNNNLQSETLFTILFLLSIFVFTEGKLRSHLLFSGILLGLAALTRPIVMYLPFFLIPIILIRKKKILCNVHVGFFPCHMSLDC